MKYSIIYIIIILSFFSCQGKHKKIFKKQYYPTGELKSKGWYIQDSIPIDTIITFYTSGDILGVDIFDSLGYYKKATGYYKNGNVNETINYENGLANGFWYHFYEDGKVKSKVFCLNDSNVGDAYWYDKSGNVVSYNFLDWGKHNINLIKYDSTVKIIQETRQVVFLDSSKIYTDSLDKDNSPNYNLLLIISNPPFCKSEVKIDFLNQNNQLIKRDIVTNKNNYLINEKIADTISAIYIAGVQYDSINKKNIFQNKRISLIKKND